MAVREPSTTRRRVLGAALAFPVLTLAAPVIASEAKQSSPPRRATVIWDRRLAHYRRIAAEAEQAAATGWFRAANDRYHREMAAIKTLRAAQPERDDKRIQRLRRAAFKRIDKAENAYWRLCTDPMQKAAVALVVTPAPDLAALQIKLVVIRAQQLHERDSMSRDVFAVLEEDVRLVTS